MQTKRFIAVLLALMLVLACVPAQAEEGRNLLRNAGFEELDGTGLPVGWRTSAYHSQVGYTVFGVSSEARSGQSSVQVNNIGENDARFEQTVKVEPASLYRLSGYVRADGILESGWGANLSVADVYINPMRVYETDGEWMYTEIYGETGPDQRELTVYARVGGFSGESRGKAQFDDLSLTKVESVPLGYTAEKWYRQTTPVVASAQKQNSDDEASPFWPQLLIICAAYVLCVAFFALCGRWTATKKRERGVPVVFTVGLLLAFVLRVIIAAHVDGYQVDVGCFQAWSGLMAQKGPGEFYQSVSYCDYPPAYMYVLGLNNLMQRAVSSLCGGSLPDWLRPTFFIKLLPMLCDIGIAALVYKMAAVNGLNRHKSTAIGLLVAFNPVLVINSAAWCQVDAVLALLLLIVCLLAIQRRWTLLMPVYVLAILVKPQALMVGPLGLAVIVMALVKDRKQWKPMLIGVAAALGVAVVLVLPFMFGSGGVYLLNEDGHFWLTDLYAKTLGSYPYATVNTANLYYLFGGNWSSLANTAHRGVEAVLALICILWGAWEFALLFHRRKKLYWLEPALSACFAAAFIVMAFAGASWETVGYTAMALAFAIVLPLMIRAGKIELLPLMGGVLFLLLYVLGTKMHERYLFPALVLLAVSYARKRDGKVLLLLLIASCTMFVNEGIVLDNSIRLGSSMGHLNNDTKTLNMLLSFVNVGAVVLALATASLADAENEVQRTFLPRYEKRPADIANFDCDARLHWKRIDTVLVLSVTAVYSVLALCNLGSTKAPQSMWTPVYMEDNVVLDLGEHHDNMTMLYYCAVSSHDFSVETSDDAQHWSQPYWAEMKEGLCYRWRYLAPCTIGEDGSRKFINSSRLSGAQRLSGRYVRITAQQVGLRLGEVVFRDENGQAIDARLFSASNVQPGTNVEGLTDEQDTITGDPSWYNGTYFDEIYHARTAKEMVDGTSIYETSHPPLGKVMMSWSVAVFGMTPFGWRFAGALMGILMLPAIYLLARQLTKRTEFAFAAMCMMTLDCMHFTQTRIATIDSFPVLFIILSYFFMLRFMQRDITALPIRKLLPDLALSGLFMGCGIASKWIGVYAGAGLAVLFFWTCARHVRLAVESIRMLRTGVKLTKNERAALSFRADHTLKRLFFICLWCVLFFIVVPVVIYLLAYIPHLAYARPQGLLEYVKMVIAQQQSMFQYHSAPGLGMDHPYYSPWYEWPVIGKPMYYYSAQYMPEGFSQSIYCLGNPAVWLVGLAGLAAVCFTWVRRHLYHLTGTDDRLHLYADTWKLGPAFVLIGFMAQYLPWVLVPRGTYIYHYFASVPFLILAVTLLLYWIWQRYPRLSRVLLIAYLVVCAIFFVIYYPYASGIPAPKWWLEIGKKMLNVYYAP